MSVLAHKPAKRGRVISCTQVIGTGFGVEVFAAVAEGVCVRYVGIFLNAKSVVVIFLRNFSGAVGQLHNIPMSVGQVVGKRRIVPDENDRFLL